MATTIVHDTSEGVELYASQCLYMKPIARLTMTVMLPEFKEPSRSISNWEVMEKLKDMVYPDLFLNLKVSKSTADFIRFEGEVENKGLLRTVIAKLHGRTVDINGGLRVLAAEAQYEYPTPQDWESFFKSREGRYDDLANLLPDTLHIEGLPCKWFASRESNGEKPCEEIVKNVFAIFGTVRNIDVPMLDPYREDTAGKNFFSLGGLQTFDAYIQYIENSDFIKAMETLRGMKLLYKGDDGKALACSIKVTFDTTDHLSEEAIQKRHLERLKLQELEQQRKEEKRREKEEEEAAERRRKENEEKARKKKRLRRKEQRQKERQEKRCLRKLQELQTAEEPCSDEWETRKFLLAQRRVASIRLLTVLLNKVKDLAEVKHQNQDEEEHSQNFEIKQDMPSNESEKLHTEEMDKLNMEAEGNKADNKPEDSTVKDQSEGENEVKEVKHDDCHIVEPEDQKTQAAAVKEMVTTPEVQNLTNTECVEVKEEPQATSGPICEVPEKEKTPTLLLPLSKTLTAKQIMEQSYDDLFSAKTKTKQYLDCGALQVTINQNCKKPKLNEREKSCSLDVGPLRTVTDINNRKKQKIYETDEFIHYLLNHYESPRYARILESQPDLVDKFIWHREVSENGDGFKVHLKNSGEQLAEINTVHDFEAEDQYADQYSWKITITETEPNQKLPKVANKKQPVPLCEELQVQLSNSTTVSSSKKHKLLSKSTSKEVVSTSDVKKMKLSDQLGSNSGKSNNTASKLAKPVYKGKGAVHELRDVLEEISSESEYFSEESRRDHKIKKTGKRSDSYVPQPKPTKHDLGSLVKVVKAKKKLASAKRFTRGSSVPLSKLALKSRTDKKGSKKVIKKKSKVKSKKLKNGKRHEEQETDLECVQKLKALNKKKKKKHLLQKKVLLEETELSESDSSVSESQKVHLKKKNKLKQSKSLEKVKCSSDESVGDEYAFENTNRFANRQRKTKYCRDEVVDKHSFHDKMFNQSYEFNDENYYYRPYIQDYNVQKDMPNKIKGFDTRHLQYRHLMKKDSPNKKRMKIEK